jgi:hypothetical protein
MKKFAVIERPQYPRPSNLSDALADAIVSASLRKTVYVSPSGRAFWLNDPAQARAQESRHGGHVYPPIEA